MSEIEGLRAEIAALRKKVDELEARPPVLVEHHYHYPQQPVPQYPSWPYSPPFFTTGGGGTYI